MRILVTKKTGPKPRFWFCRPFPDGVSVLRPVRPVAADLGLDPLVGALLVVDPQQAVTTVEGEALETVDGAFVAPGTAGDATTGVNGSDLAATADGIHIGNGVQVVDG